MYFSVQKTMMIPWKVLTCKAHVVSHGYKREGFQNMLDLINENPEYFTNAYNKKET